MNLKTPLAIVAAILLLAAFIIPFFVFPDHLLKDDSGRRILKFYFLVLFTFIFGFFGGLVLSIGSRRDNALWLPFNERKINLGFLGDGIIGAGAAFAILFAAQDIFKINMEDVFRSANRFFYFAAVCVIAGFSGISILQALSRALSQGLSALDKGRLDQMEKNTAVQDPLRTAEVYLQSASEKIKIMKDSAANNVKPSEETVSLFNEYYDQAMRYIEKALSIDPENEQALFAKARAIRRQAEASAPPDSAKLFGEAIEILDKLIRWNPKSALAVYRRGCYKQLRGDKPEDVLKDIKAAFDLDPSQRKYAENDPDLDKIKEDVKKL